MAGRAGAQDRLDGERLPQLHLVGLVVAAVHDHGGRVEDGADAMPAELPDDLEPAGAVTLAMPRCRHPDSLAP